MSEAARLADALAHRHASGRWLATGGGGYDAYRVVPRAWALTWLAGAHREIPVSTPESWRDRWSGEAARYGQVPMPTTMLDGPDVGRPADGSRVAIDARALETASLVRRAVVPRLVREAVDRGWWSPEGGAAGAAAMPVAARPSRGAATVIDAVDASVWARLTLAPRVVAPFDPVSAHGLVAAALADGAVVTAAVRDTTVVGLLVVGRAARGESAGGDSVGGGSAGGELLALGVAPDWRRSGLARELLSVEARRGAGAATGAELSMAERDVVEPLDRSVRAAIGRRILEGAGFTVVPPDPALQSIDPMLLRVERPAARPA